MHPLDDVTRGEALVKQVYEAVRASPHWAESLLIIAYDEHGGFYDHVPPPPGVPPGDPELPGLNHHGFVFDQLGVRVPAVVISPLIERGVVDHTVLEHSSVPATLEHLFDLKPMTARDAAASTLEHLLTRQAPRDDCPLLLPTPADSGLADCEDGQTSNLAAELETIPQHLEGDYEPALAGFLQVAVAREIQLAAAVDRDVDRAMRSERARLESDYSAVKSKFDAVRILRDVEKRYQNWRSSVSTAAWHPRGPTISGSGAVLD
jgi:phospholipase C